MRKQQLIFAPLLFLTIYSCCGQSNKSEIKDTSSTPLSIQDVRQMIMRDETTPLPEHLKKGFEPHPFTEKTRKYGDVILSRNLDGLLRHDHTDSKSEINVLELPYNTLLYSTDYGPRYKRSPIILRLDYYDEEKQKVLYTTDLVALNPYKDLPVIDTTFPDFVDTYDLYWNDECDYSQTPNATKYIIDTHIESSYYGFHQVVYRLFGVNTEESEQVVSLEETIIILDQKGKPIYTYKWDKILNGSAVSSDGKSWVMTSQDYGGPLGKCKCVFQVVDLSSKKIVFQKIEDSEKINFNGPFEIYKSDFFQIFMNDQKQSALEKNGKKTVYYLDSRNINFFKQTFSEEEYSKSAKNFKDEYLNRLSKYPLTFIKLK